MDPGSGLTIVSDTPFELVTTPEQLARVVDACAGASRVAIDTEANSRHHYPEHVCLVQVGVAGSVFLIDPLAVPDLTPLGPVLADRSIEKLLHGADYDLRGLHRDWGLTFANVFDSYVVGRLVGLEEVGLGALLRDVLGVEIPKDARLQKQDWSLRPLTDVALAYAAEDVAYLDRLRDALAQRLSEKGREAWAAEEFARLEGVRYSPPDPDRGLFSMKESRALGGRGLAVMKALLAFRDDTARRTDRPPAFIVPNSLLGELAADPSLDPRDAVSATPGLVRRYGDGLRRALREGRSAAEVARPVPPRPEGPRASRAETAVIRERLKRLKDWRNAQATAYGLDPALVWPARSLERLAREPQAANDELAAAEVRGWQRAEFGGMLVDAVGALASRPVAPPGG